MTTVIAMRDAPRGWRSDPKYTYIGRGSDWGNKYRIGDRHPDAPNRPMTRAEVIRQYTGDLLKNVELMGRINNGELDDTILVCHCKPEPCHGDVLKWFSDIRLNRW